MDGASLIAYWSEGESQPGYNSDNNKETVHEDSVSEDTYHTQEDEESVNSGSTSEVIQNINMLNQGSGVNNGNQPNYNMTSKFMRHFI